MTAIGDPILHGKSDASTLSAPTFPIRFAANLVRLDIDDNVALRLDGNQIDVIDRRQFV
jgi:hypothetical protein